MDLPSDRLKTAGNLVKEMNTLVEPVNQNQPKSREALLALSHQLIAALETPSETVQRIGWAEVRRLVDSRKDFRSCGMHKLIASSRPVLQQSERQLT